MADKSIDEMSDEELMQLPDPEGTENTDFFNEGSEDTTFEQELDTAAEEPAAEEPQAEPEQTEEVEAAAEGEAAETSEEEPEEEETTDEPVAAEAEADPVEAEAEEAPEKKTESADSENEQATKEEPKTEEEETDYKALYESVMAPFKANGRDFKPETPEEAVRLMQQGANYVKKMTALKPNLKLMRMLQNQDLLDEGKLSFLIDVHRRDPAAIQKLLKDGNVDPMSIDTEEETKYRPGDHKVSDDEMAFHSTLEDVLASATGSATVKLINDTWDAKSKEEVYRDPDILKLMDSHRQAGIYDKIATEIDRQVTLGELSTNIPFIEAYKNVGDKLHAAGQLTPKTQAQGNKPAAPGSPEQTRRPVATSKPRRQTASNGDRAKAASPTRTSPTPPKQNFDPMAMSDEELMKATSPRF